jgi:peptide/nickel transport system substrate-binding protein
MSEDGASLYHDLMTGRVSRVDFLRRAAALGLGAPTIAAILAACGSSSTGGSSSASSGAVPQVGTAVTTPPPAGELDQLKWGLFYEPGPLDWIYDYNYEENTVVANITESLMRLTPQLTIEPSLAASYAAKDPLTHVYQIRQGVTFHDGSPMTTADVVFSLRRHFNPNSYWAFAYFNVKSVDQTGPWEVTVRMKQSDLTFPPLMCTPAGGVGKAADVKAKGKNYGTASAGPIGTGPFMFTKWTSGANITLSRNESYWDTAHAPKTKSVVFSFLPEESTMTTGLVSGEIDGAYHTPYSGLEQLRSSGVGTLYLGKSMLFTIVYITTTTGPLANTDVRRALLMAIDRQALAKTVYSGAATALPSTQVPLGQWGYAQAQAAAAWQKLPPPVLDLTEAKKLVAGAGVDTSGTIVIATRASFQRYINIASIVQDAGKKLGLDIQIKSINPNDYGDLFFSDSARKGIDLFISENYADIPEPLETLYPAVTPQPPDAVSYNYNAYNNPTVTSDLRQALSETDDAKRAALILGAQSVLAAQPASLPLVSPAVPLFMNKRVTGAPASFCYLYYPWARDIGAA